MLSRLATTTAALGAALAVAAAAPPAAPAAPDPAGCTEQIAYDPTIPTTFKDRFYRQIYAAIEADVARGGPLAGSNFWAWNGEARTPHADHRFRRGDLGYMGDPPHEPQGWYSVFDSDASTHAIIRNYAAAAKALA